jgi:hypothetical protein
VPCDPDYSDRRWNVLWGHAGPVCFSFLLFAFVSPLTLLQQHYYAAASAAINGTTVNKKREGAGRKKIPVFLHFSFSGTLFLLFLF